VTSIPKTHAPVRFLATLGAVPAGDAGHATKYTGEVTAGQTGLYQGPAPGHLGGLDWHVVQFGAWDIVCHRSHFEEVTP
jgi:hypothetical protein